MRRPGIRAAALGFPSGGPRASLTAARDDALAGRITVAELEARAADVRRARLHCHARPGDGTAPVLATTGDFTVAGRAADAAVFAGALPHAIQSIPSGPERALAALADGLRPRLGWGPLRLDARKALLEAAEARAHQVEHRTVLPGPISLLLGLDEL